MTKKKKNRSRKKSGSAQGANFPQPIEEEKTPDYEDAVPSTSSQNPDVMSSKAKGKKSLKKSTNINLTSNPTLEEDISPNVSAVTITQAEPEEPNSELYDNLISTLESIKIDLKLHFSEELDMNLNAKWRKPKKKVPDIFIHKSVDLMDHAHRLLSQHINFFHPYRGRYSTKLCCPSMKDYKALKKYLEKYQLPYHTFGLASKHKMKVIIRGIEKEIDTDQLKSDIINAGIPVLRVHRMKNKNVERCPLYLAVVPNDSEGRKLLCLKSVLGKDIKLEPPQVKAKQCYRCQMWGHAQRYCYGLPKCVKCAGNHLSRQCERNPDDPLKCANCRQIGHVASWQKCPSCPYSDVHKVTLKQKQKNKKVSSVRSKPLLVTHKTCNALYRNISYE